MLTVIVASVFASISLLAVACLYPLLSRYDTVRQRVNKLMPEHEEELTLIPRQKKWQTVLAELGTKLKTKPTELRIYREAVTAAGFKKDAVFVFLGAKVLLAVVMPAMYMVLFAVPHGGVNSTSLLLAILCSIGGYLLPTVWLSHVAAKRKENIFHALPDVLDLLTVCVEAGLSLDAALVRTIENFEQRDSPLIKELNTAALEIRAGMVRSEALKGVAERTVVEDIKGLIAMLIQTERFGTSLGRTLRTYSDSLRTKRRQRAEEQAAKTAVKMLFPLTFFVFPALMVVMLLPAFYQMYFMFKK